jgi:hypothetical protein
MGAWSGCKLIGDVSVVHGFFALFAVQCSRVGRMMGGKQSLEEGDDIAIPRSPTSPRVLPVDDGETSKADDPNRLNYTINAVEAIVDNRSQRTETRITALETKIDTLKVMIQKLLDAKEQS